MTIAAQSDEAVVEKARRVLAAKQRVRWVMLIYAVLFIGMSIWFTLAGIRKIEGLESEQLNKGFIFGLALAVVWTSFGVFGTLSLGKFLVGVSRDFRIQELLVRYHDRLRDLGQLPEEKRSEQPNPRKALTVQF